jgi:subtilase family serine protease
VLAVAASTSLSAHAAPATNARLDHDNVTPGLAHVVRLGHTDPNRVLDISVSLGLHHQAALTDFYQRVSDPRSPGYGRYLTPSKFAATYGPSADEVRQVTDHLRANGLKVTSISSNRTLIDATGPIRSVEAAFGVIISDWHDPDLKRDFYGNDAQPSLPAAIAPLVIGIFGLNNHYRFHHHAQSPSPFGGGQGGGQRAPRVPPGSGPAGGYSPSNLKTAYSVDAPATSGINGSGQGIGLFELDGFNQANITKYDTQYSLTTTPPVPQLVDGGPVPPLGSGQVEVELDIEVIHAFAPSAALTVFEAPNTDTGALHGFTAMVTNNLGANSTSWGSCEPQTSGAFMDTLHQTLLQAAAQGQSFFAASGDFGAYDCANGQPPNTTQLAVDSPANDPMMTGVGGTTLALNANFTYSSEAAWSFTGTSPARGSGGGLSAHFARPIWQTGPGVSNTYSNGGRQVPDVALDADPATGYSICVTTCASSPPGQGWNVLGGTSGAAPSWAAFAALYNQYAVGAGRFRVGFANPMLYNLASNPQTSAPYHDLTAGSNLFYSATAGWDYATGWGSPQVSNLVVDITQNPPVPPWVIQATTAFAGGTPAAPPRRWYGGPSVARVGAVGSPSSLVTSPSPARGGGQGGGPVSPSSAGGLAGGYQWVTHFMPEMMARLTGWLSSR